MKRIDFDLKNFTNEEIQKLKDLAYVDGELKSRKIVKTSVFRYIPSLKDKIDKNYFRESIYCLLNGIERIPLCPICGKPNRLRYFNNGFQTYCSRECVNEHQRIDPGFIAKSKETKRRKSKEIAKQRGYKLIGKNWILYPNYCKHGDLKIHSGIYQRSIQRGITACPECRKEIYENYNPSDEEVIEFQKGFKEFWTEEIHDYNQKQWMARFPKEKKLIEEYVRRFFDDNGIPPSSRETYYILSYGLKERPKCPVCEKPVMFNLYNWTYQTGCYEHRFTYAASKVEIAIKKFVEEDLDQEIILNTRSFIGKEIDILIPEKKIAIEYNGVFYHSSEKIPDEKTEWKRLRLLEKGYELITIWEDNWDENKSLIEEYIKRKIEGNLLFDDYLNYQRKISGIENKDLDKIIWNYDFGSDNFILENGYKQIEYMVKKCPLRKHKRYFDDVKDGETYCCNSGIGIFRKI